MTKGGKLKRPPLNELPQRIKLSLSAIAKLLYTRPAYLLLAVGVSILFYEIVFWSLNIGLLQYLMTTEFLTPGDKLGVLLGSYTGIFSLPLAPLSMLIFIVSLLQGVAVAVLAYMIRKERALNKSMVGELGGTGAAGVLAVLGLGCVPCGTSLVTPILTFFFASSSAVVAEQVGLYAAIFAVIVSLVTLYLAGIKLSQKLEM